MSTQVGCDWVALVALGFAAAFLGALAGEAGFLTADMVLRGEGGDVEEGGGSVQVAIQQTLARAVAVYLLSIATVHNI
jgi:hypothetical protein